MLQILDCEQGSESWFRARAGLPTGSEFATILAKGKDGKSPSVTRRTYMLKLAGERLTGEPMENYSNGYMDRGKRLEPEARDLYAFTANVDPEQVGFIHCTERLAGCSPDSLIGDTGLLEIKTKAPHLLIECLMKGEFPPEHKAQCQGALWITGREWIDLAVFYPKLPLFVRRAPRDEAYIATLAAAVAQFNEELEAVVAFVRNRNGMSTLAEQLRASVEAA